MSDTSETPSNEALEVTPAAFIVKVTLNSSGRAQHLLHGLASSALEVVGKRMLGPLGLGEAGTLLSGMAAKELGGGVRQELNAFFGSTSLQIQDRAELNDPRSVDRISALGTLMLSYLDPSRSDALQQLVQEEKSSQQKGHSKRSSATRTLDMVVYTGSRLDRQKTTLNDALDKAQVMLDSSHFANLATYFINVVPSAEALSSLATATSGEHIFQLRSLGNSGQLNAEAAFQQELAYFIGKLTLILAAAQDVQDFELIGVPSSFIVPGNDEQNQERQSIMMAAMQVVTLLIKNRPNQLRIIMEGLQIGR